MKKGVCKLCKEIKFLCKKSHILPKHTYKILKENGYSLYIDRETIKKEHGKKDYSGIFEANILCEDCEKIFNKFETYANNLIYLSRIKNTDKQIIDSKIIISGIGYDYKKIKLYFLSILWRSCISSKEFFNQVRLDDEDEEKIRKMLLDDSPGKEFEFPIILSLPDLIQGAGFDSQDVLMTQKPYKSEINNLDAYVFMITGQSIYFIIGESKLHTVRRDNLTIFLKNKEETLKQREQRKQMIKNML